MQFDFYPVMIIILHHLIMAVLRNLKERTTTKKNNNKRLHFTNLSGEQFTLKFLVVDLVHSLKACFVFR